MSIPHARPRRALRATALSVAVSLALAAAPAARATPADDIAALQKALAEMKADYDHRLAALESQLQAAKAAAAATPAPAPEPAPAPPPAAEPAGGAGAASAFNPAVSLILSGTYAHTTQDPARYRLTGVSLPPGAEIGPGTRGFSLAESELSLAANIDPWLRGAINLSIHPDDSIEAEEAFVQTTALPDGLGLKFGRFFSGVGYLNSQHTHTWDFVDAPLAYQAFLGTQFHDDGLQLRWLAPLDEYLELGAEIGRGRGYPGGYGNDGTGSNGPGAWALTAHTGGDIGDSQSWRAGLSLLHARAGDQALAAQDGAGDDVPEAFTGRTRVWVLDGVWKWAPDGNATRTNVKLQGEWLRSERAGALAVGDGAVATPWRATQSGGYVQAVWQFAPTWRTGLREDWLDTGRDAAQPAGWVDGYAPHKTSWMLDFNPSEFSRIRLQLARDDARRGASDTQVMLQYQVSLGAHGAHSF